MGPGLYFVAEDPIAIGLGFALKVDVQRKRDFEMKTLFMLALGIGFGFSPSVNAKISVFQGPEVKDSAQVCPLKSGDDQNRRQELSKSWESLPNGVLVAKEAHMTIDGEDFHFESLQNFLKPGLLPTICVSGKEIPNQRVSILAPTLIDTKVQAKTGSSVWNFQILSDQKKVRAWNVLSQVFTKSFDLGKVFKDQGAQEKYYRTSANEYEVVVVKESAGRTATLTISYTVENLP